MIRPLQGRGEFFVATRIRRFHLRLLMFVPFGEQGLQKYEHLPYAYRFAFSPFAPIIVGRPQFASWPPVFIQGRSPRQTP